MAKDDQQIPTDAGKHHTWGTSQPKKYTGRHRPVKRTENKENGKKEE